jgi:hypothetical protein
MMDADNGTIILAFRTGNGNMADFAKEQITKATAKARMTGHQFESEQLQCRFF